MKQTSPELDIPEGVFYDEIEGYNIYVKQKDRETGMLKDVLIYNFSDGFENAHIIWASEGKMEMTADKQHLYLHLYNGEQFENLKSQTISSNNVPYRRETFREKHTIIEFDGGFNMVDGSFLSDRSDSKNMIEISQSIDSLNHRADSLGRSMYNEIKASTYRNIVLSKTDSAKIVETNNKINVDSLFNSYTLAEKERHWVVRRIVPRHCQRMEHEKLSNYRCGQQYPETRSRLAQKNHPLSQLFDFLFHRCAFGSHHPQRRFRNARSGIRLNFRNLLYH